jgi:GlpG protein
MRMVRALTVGADENLALFCTYLGQRGCAHRVYEEQGTQVLEVTNEAAAEQVRSDYAAWREGRLHLQWRQGVGRARTPWLPILRRFPVVVGLIGLAVLAFPVTIGLSAGFGGPLFSLLTIVPVDAPLTGAPRDVLVAALAAGQWWRLVTPIFLHFGIVHLLFNAAIVIEFGRRIERGAGSWFLVALTLAIAIASNVVQFYVAGTALFGGLSGVAYGLFGYVVVRGRFEVGLDWRVNPSLVVGVVVILVLMSSGVTEAFGLHIANTAHWVGLGVGATFAVLWRPARRVALDVR